jgi:dynamin 1-like protein
MSSVIQNKQEKERKAQAFERRKERDRRKPTSMSNSSVPPMLNGEGGPEYEENPIIERARMMHGRGESRSISPAPGSLESSAISSAMNINGRPSSPQVHPSSGSTTNKTTDSFLNYFFGKEGSMPATSGAAPRSAPEPSFTQSIRRGMERNEKPAFDMSRLSQNFDDTSLEPTPTFTPTPDEPALTEREQMETELIRRLISSYFNIVRETIQDQVPKAVMHFLVNFSKDAVQNRLVTELYKEEFFGDLLYEDDAIKAEREKCERLLKTYREASKIIGEVGL